MYFVLSLIAKIALNVAVLAAGSVSFLHSYEPQMPEQLIKVIR